MDPLSLLLGVGGSIVSGVLGNQGAKAQADATNRATDIQKQQYDTSLGLLQPQIDAGNTARSYALGGLGLPGGVDQQTAQNAFTTSPGYAFRMGQGVSAIDQSAANRGTLDSGATAKSLLRYGQDYGSNEFGNYYSRLMGLANGGAGATGQAVQVGQNYGDNASNIALGEGQQRASSYTNMGNNINNTLSGAGGLIAKYGLPGAGSYNPANGIKPQPQSYYSP